MDNFEQKVREILPKLLKESLGSFSNQTVPQHRHNGVDSLLINYTNRLGIGTTDIGTYQLAVEGDAYVSGKLTVVGAIDPTSVTLSDPANAAYYQASDGINAGVAPANEGRLRYNTSTQVWQMSMNGASYVDIQPSVGVGTVTAVSVVSTNGFSAIVANPNTTPTITMQTTVTGLIKGDGTAMSAAVPGTDYQLPITAAALTKVDDTNVTLTLGGTPATALLQATSITAGWTGQLSISRGGTGQTTANNALNALLPTQTSNAGKILATDGTNTSWVTAGSISTGFTQGSVIFQGAVGLLTEDNANFFYDDTNNRFGLNLAGVAPSYNLDMIGDFRVRAQGGTPQSATGGTITTVGAYTVHTFTTSGTFTPSTNMAVEYLIVAAGGGGGANCGGGGGAGGVVQGAASFSPGALTVTVGTGSAGANGGNSSVTGLTTAIGGGAGSNNGSPNASAGGSGGGGGGNSGAGGAGTAGQGNAGGAAPSGGGSAPFATGGGGGAGAVGQTAPSNTQAGAGGDGIVSSISGSPVTYGGGGGGGAGNAGGVRGLGGAGGGGNGSNASTGAGANGTANTGGGGGGAGQAGAASTGGSGIVIIRYLTAGLNTTTISGDLSGRVGIGTVLQSAWLHLPAGTATAGFSPLKFTSGTNLTTAEAGAMEYDGTQLYFSPSNSDRNILLQNVNSTAFTAGSIPFATTSGYLNQSNSQLFWDNTNSRLGLGTNAPAYKFDIADATANGRGINIAQTGASGTVYGIVSQTTGSNALGINNGGLFLASGGGTNYSIYVNSTTAGANNYSIYAPGAAKSYFAGDVTIGTTTPQRKLTVYYDPGAGAAAGMAFGNSRAGGALLGILGTATGHALGASKIVFNDDATNTFLQTFDFANKRTGFGNANATPWAGTSPAGLVHVWNTISTEIVSIFQAATSQTADLTQWRKQDATVYGKVDATGNLFMPTIKATSAGGYISSDGSTGATGSFTAQSGETVTVKDGLITSIV